MPSILHKRPFSWLVWVALYCAISLPVMWLNGQTQPSGATPILAPQENPPAVKPEPPKLESVTDTGLGPEISVPPMKPGNVKLPPKNRIDQSDEMVKKKSAGCIECHKTTDAHTMHASPNVVLGCTDCHTGNPKRGLSIEKAHPKPLNPDYWPSSANPPNSTTLLNHESPEWIQFVNPGDLRVAQKTCGLCHGEVTHNVGHSMMNHGAMLWGAAAYNNGAVPLKDAFVGQAYGLYGQALKLEAPFAPTKAETLKYGWLPTLFPLPRFNLGMPGNLFRIFEKGGFTPLELGTPFLDEPPGKPDRRLSERGLGTKTRIDPVILGAQKTRLHDPLLGFLGSNDRPGDYRSSGCTACHVVYANDRSPTNSGWWSKYGHQGLSFSKDPTLPKNERGHPVKHVFTRSIPSAMCMNCHMHQGNLFVNPYLGMTWWDQETEGHLMYPNPQNPLAGDAYWRDGKSKASMLKQKNPTEAEMVSATRANPEAAAARGLWGSTDFLEKVSELNPKMKHTQFADYHGHGWVFRAVFKRDKKGNLLDLEDKVLPHGDWKNAVHLNDIHIKKGMQCADCHFDVDVHGNGLIYGEPRNATTIVCIDCHGTVSARPTMLTSGAGGTWDGKSRKTEPVDLTKSVTPWKPRFEWEGERLFQNSVMSPDMRWEVPQTTDVVNPQSPKYNAKAAHAKTLRRDGDTWGELPPASQCAEKLAHSNERMDCQICHTSWATSCFGCHLSMKANQRVPLNKFEGALDRNFTTYNPQIVRDDVFQLGIDSTVKNHRMAVLRSSSAVVVSSQNANREWVYSQQQTVSAEGYAGQAYNPHFAHTTSSRGTTKNCTDCHISKANDNNAWMTSLLGFGTGTVNFFGRYAWVGSEGSVYAAVWTEADEPQAPIGSSFQKLAYSDNHAKHVAAGRELKIGYEHHAGEVRDLTLRSEYLYAACGHDGLRVYDVANIDNKGFSERFLTQPVSPLGMQTHVKLEDCTSVALPSTLLNDPKRTHLPENQEQPIHDVYGFVFATDRKEGLVIVDTTCLMNGDPADNYLKKDAVFNPDGKFAGAEYAVCAGSRVYICTPRGVFVVDVREPLKPRLVGEYTGDFLREPRAISVQFRYAFVTDVDGLKVLDITNPEKPYPMRGASVPLKHAGKLYVARTYAYVANGADGLAIIDVENPEHPKLDQMFTADGALNDVHAVQIGSVAASMYALVADGKNGLRVLQMISPDREPNSYGFTPRPKPLLIATYPTKHHALAVSRGLDRDRVVDETGGQTVVFGRRGARPFHIDEMNKFLRHKDGELFKVDDVRMKLIEEERDIAGVKVKIPRTVLETKAGKPLPEPKWPAPPKVDPTAPKPEVLPVTDPLQPVSVPAPTPPPTGSPFKP